MSLCRIIHSLAEAFGNFVASQLAGRVAVFLMAYGWGALTMYAVDAVACARWFV